MKFIVALNLVGHSVQLEFLVEAMPNSGLLLLGENITLVLIYWSFGIFGGFSWNEILSCVVMLGSSSSKFVCCFGIWFSLVHLCCCSCLGARSVLVSWALSCELHRRALFVFRFEQGNLLNPIFLDLMLFCLRREKFICLKFGGYGADWYHHPSVGVCRARQLNAELCVHPDLSGDMGFQFVIIIYFECVFSWLFNC